MSIAKDKMWFYVTVQLLKWLFLARRRAWVMELEMGYQDPRRNADDFCSRFPARRPTACHPTFGKLLQFSGPMASDGWQLEIPGLL